MDFIRWIILKWEKPLFEQGLIIPFVVLTTMLTSLSFLASPIVGFIVLSLFVILWGMVSYVFISSAMKAFYKKYEEDKARESKTP